MNTRSRVRSAYEVSEVFATTDTEFDDSDSETESEDEDEDHIQPTNADELEEDTVSDDESETEAAAPPPLKKRRCHTSSLNSKSGFTWSPKPPRPQPRSRRSQVEHYTAMPKGEGLNASTPLEAWSLLFTEAMLNIILIHTNEEIDRYVAKSKKSGRRVESYHKTADLVELKAFVGLLYFTGMYRLSKMKTRNLWSPCGISLFRLTMSENRFVFLLRSMRFDDKNTRADRKATDRLASIRRVWDLFNTNCTTSYEPGTDCTIGEQLLPFCGRCSSFKTFAPAKPDTCGLKIVLINDAITHYMLAAIPRVRDVVDKDPAETVPSYYVRKLSESIHHTGRNITCDNRFTSIPICERMKTKYGLTMIGTIRKNEHGIPEELKKMPPAGTNVQFAYHGGKTLVSFNPRSNEIVLLLSSLHRNGVIGAATGKPEIVIKYEETKSGTDGFDEKCRDYTTARKTRRWPMRIFYGMLDQANVNCLILYTLRADNKKMDRPDFILDLSMALIKPLLARRLTLPTMRSTLKVQIQAIVGKQDIPDDEAPKLLSAENTMEKQKTCYFCPFSLDRKTYCKCLRCLQPMCKEHAAKYAASAATD